MLKLSPKLLLIAFGFGLGYQSPHSSKPPSLREVYEILADFDVRHVPDIPGVPYYGSSDMPHRVIYIVDNQDHSFKVRTAIHELTHVAQHIRAEQDDEDSVNIIEEEEYKRLFVNDRN